MNVYEDIHYYEFDHQQPLELKSQNINSGFKQGFKKDAVLFDTD